MKKLVLIPLVFMAIVGSAQPSLNCEQVKAENANLKNTIESLKQDTAFLHSKLNYFNTISTNNASNISSFTSSYDVKFLSCFGDRGAQTVRIEYVVHHKKVHQSVIVATDKCLAYDEIGNVFDLKEATIGNYRVGTLDATLIPTDIDVKGSLLFRGIIGGTDILKLILIPVVTKDKDGGANRLEGKIEMRNIKINWL